MRPVLSWSADRVDFVSPNSWSRAQIASDSGTDSARSPSGPVPRLDGVAKAAVQYACSECGYTTGKWLGRCPACGAWGTLVEERAALRPASQRRRGAGRPLLRLVEVEAADAERDHRPASPSSTACSAAGSCPRRSSSSAAIPGSASRRCCSWRCAAMSAERPVAARHRRGVGGAGEAARRPARRRRRRAHPRRDEPRRRLRDARARAARGLRDRLRADALRARARLGARLGRARCARPPGGCCASPRRRASRRSSSAT